MGGLLFRIIPMPLHAHFTIQYNTTLLPSVDTIALGMFCGTKHTHHTNWCFIPLCRVSQLARLVVFLWLYGRFTCVVPTNSLSTARGSFMHYPGPVVDS